MTCPNEALVCVPVESAQKADESGETETVGGFSRRAVNTACLVLGKVVQIGDGDIWFPQCSRELPPEMGVRGILQQYGFGEIEWDEALPEGDGSMRDLAQIVLAWAIINSGVLVSEVLLLKKNSYWRQSITGNMRGLLIRMGVKDGESQAQTYGNGVPSVRMTKPELQVVLSWVDRFGQNGNGAI
ncbi:MAG: hypothetical protein PHG63_00435 [Candidatus Dojkabacteria bacterium]|nr:hypothetical protein [Candidatus Dojkabacteria bacterium]